MKNILRLLCMTLMIFSIAGCNSDTKNQDTNENTTNSEKEESAEIANPFIPCESIEDAKSHLDFEMIIPEDLPDGYELSEIFAIENTLLELNYEQGTNELTYRQGKGSDDVSGDYSVYEVEKTVEVNGLDIKLMGNNTKINTATWTNGDFSFSISVNLSGDGMDEDVILSIIEKL
jgi:hypothetical protein